MITVHKSPTDTVVGRADHRGRLAGPHLALLPLRRRHLRPRRLPPPARVLVFNSLRTFPTKYNK